jgi:cyclase
MPLCYGGGVRSVEQAERLVSMGVEKVALSSAALADPQLVTRMASVVGSQSVVTVLDVRRDKKGTPEVWTHNGRRRTGRSVTDAAELMAESGAGEIIVNSIDNDGTMQGYDLPLIAAVRDAVSVPVTALGGAGSLAHIKALIERFGIVGAAAGSLFVFKGVYRAVLINYPSRAEKDALMAGASS